MLVCALLLLAGGCSFGPKVLERSHGKYYESVRQVDEEELLRNLIHMRYNEYPFTLNLSAIAAQYELSGSAEATPFFGTEADAGIFRSFSTILPSLMVGGANRPTMTFLPADEADAIRQFLSPISLEMMAFLSSTSWPASTILRLWVERINGVPNAVMASGPQRGIMSDFARFQRIADLVQLAQDRQLAFLHDEERFEEKGAPLPPESLTAGAEVEAAKHGMEYRVSEDGKSRVLSQRTRRLVLDVNPGAENSPEIGELAGLLNVVPGLRRYEVIRGNVPDPLLYPSAPATHLRLAPRSTAQVYFYLANGVEVPLEHLNCGLVKPPVDAEGRVFDGREITRGLFEVHVCQGRKHKPPKNAYIAVQYRGYWYYIDDTDQASKMTFALMLHLTRLDFSRRKSGAVPFLTLPVGK